MYGEFNRSQHNSASVSVDATCLERVSYRAGKYYYAQNISDFRPTDDACTMKINKIYDDKFPIGSPNQYAVRS